MVVAVPVDAVPAEERPGQGPLDADLTEKGGGGLVDLVLQPAHRRVFAREQALLLVPRGVVGLARLLLEDVRSQARGRLLEAGQPATHEHFTESARILLSDAKPQSENGFKVELAKRCLVHALSVATAVA